MPYRAKYPAADETRAVAIEAVARLQSEPSPGQPTTTAIAILQAVLERVAERLLTCVDEAANAASSPMTALEAMFMAHIQFIAEHPGVPRVLFGEVPHTELTVTKRMMQTLIGRYRERLQPILEQGKEAGEFAADLDNGRAASLFIATIQGLVIQSLLAGAVDRIHCDALGAFAIFRRGIEPAQ